MLRNQHSLSSLENIYDIAEEPFSCSTKIEENDVLDGTRNVLEEILKVVDKLLSDLDKDLKFELKASGMVEDVKDTLSNILMKVEKLADFSKLIIAFGDLEIEAERNSLAKDTRNSLSNIFIKSEELVSFGESLIASGKFEIEEEEEEENAVETCREILNNILIKVEELVAIAELFGDEMVVAINYLNNQTIQSNFKNELEYLFYTEDEPTGIHPLATCSTKFINSDYKVNKEVYEADCSRSDKHFENKNKCSLTQKENISSAKLTEDITEGQNAPCYIPTLKEDNSKELCHIWPMYSIKNPHFDWSQWAEAFDSNEDDLPSIPSFRVIKRHRRRKSLHTRILSCFCIKKQKSTFKG